MQNKFAIKTFVLEKLQHLSPTYYYHNIEHTLYVTQQCNIIGTHSNCTQAQLDILEIAALWHDTGFLLTYENHEEASCFLAKQYLPNFHISEEDIETICTTIMATKIPQTPVNFLGEILADADLEYLGTNHVMERSNALFKELQCINPQLSEQQWHKIQIDFLTKHRYFTSYCKEKRGPRKNEFLNNLQKNPY